MDLGTAALIIALFIAVWNWAFWMARKKPDRDTFRRDYIYVSHAPPPPPPPPRLHPRYVQDEQGRLWEVSSPAVARCIGPVSPHTISMLSERMVSELPIMSTDTYYIHDGNGELAEVRRPVYHPYGTTPNGLIDEVRVEHEKKIRERGCQMPPLTERMVTAEVEARLRWPQYFPPPIYTKGLNE